MKKILLLFLLVMTSTRGFVQVDVEHRCVCASKHISHEVDRALEEKF